MDKPAVSSVLQAMAEAYPERVDMVLLAMVLGCEAGAVETTVGELIATGMAEADATPAETTTLRHAPAITEAGMAVACGQAQLWESPIHALQRIEADNLRQLMTARVAASPLQPRQRRELRESIVGATGESLLGAAKIWAYRPVAEWTAFIQALHCPLSP
jgi:hypothetical protein